MDDYEYLKARHDILLAVVKHYANLDTWAQVKETGSWSPKRLYNHKNGETESNGYDAAHRAFNTLGEMAEKRKESKTFCEEQRKKYVNSTKHLYPDADLKG